MSNDRKASARIQVFLPPEVDLASPRATSTSPGVEVLTRVPIHLISFHWTRMQEPLVPGFDMCLAKVNPSPNPQPQFPHL